MGFPPSGTDFAPLEFPGNQLKALLCVTVARASTVWAHKKIDLGRIIGHKPEWLMRSCMPLKGRYLSEWSQGYFFPIGSTPFEIAARVLTSHHPDPLQKQKETVEAVIHPEGNVALNHAGDGYIWVPKVVSNDAGKWVRIFSTKHAIWNRKPKNEYANGTQAQVGDLVKTKKTVGWLNKLVERPVKGKVIHVANGSCLIQWEGKSKHHYLMSSLYPCEELFPFEAQDTSNLSEAQVRAYEGILSGEYTLESRGLKKKQLIVRGKTVPSSVTNVLLQENLLPEDILNEIARTPSVSSKLAKSEYP